MNISYILFTMFREPTYNPEKRNPLKREHLKEGIMPIMACVGTPSQFRDESGTEKTIASNYFEKKNGTQNVNYYGDPDDLEIKGFKNNGKETYVISTVDSEDKFSRNFRDCTGILVAGQDKKTGENISFLTHQDPEEFFHKKDKECFLRDLRERLAELKDRSADGTVDAVIVGGNWFQNGEDTGDFDISPKTYQKGYKYSIDYLEKEVEAAFGFEPTILTGPKRSGGEDDVYYDNKNRRLYIMRPEVGNGSTESFVPSDIREQEKKW